MSACEYRVCHPVCMLKVFSCTGQVVGAAKLLCDCCLFGRIYSDCSSDLLSPRAHSSWVVLPCSFHVLHMWLL